MFNGHRLAIGDVTSEAYKKVGLLRASDKSPSQHKKAEDPAKHGIGFIHLRYCRHSHRREILEQCINNENRSEQNNSFRESVVDPVGISRNDRIPALLVNG
jgi:hypothetical protein